MGIEKIRRRLQVNGNVTFGSAGDAGWTRSSANVIQAVSGDTVDLGSNTLAIPAGTVALTTSNLSTALPGDIRLGYTGTTIQLGFVVNGTAYIMSGTAGGGAITLATA